MNFWQKNKQLTDPTDTMIVPFIITDVWRYVMANESLHVPNMLCKHQVWAAICSWHLSLAPPYLTVSVSDPRLIVTTLSVSLDPACGQQLPLRNISRRSFMVLVNLLKHQLIKINITYHCLLLLKILCLKYLMISQVVTAKCLRSCSL